MTAPDSLPRHKKSLILVVDDSATLRLMARDALEEDELEVLEAADGEEGLRVFREHQPSAVLLDVNMPRLDGFGMCEAIRAAPVGSNTPVLMMTAASHMDSIHRAYQAGATDFMTKPINWLILSQRVRYMLRMGEVLAALSKSEERLATAQRVARLGNWEFDLRTRDFDYSREFRRLYEITAGDGGAERVLGLIHPDDQEAVRESIERAVVEGASFDVEHRIILHNAKQRYIKLQGRTVFGENGEPIEVSGTALDITESKNSEAEIRFLALHDSLTRLGNRRLFKEQLNHALAQSRRNQTSVGVLFLDLDNFKRINDTLGHSAGDFLLQGVADRMLNCVRESDSISRSRPESENPSVSRLGGDEFIIGLSNMQNPDEATLVVERIFDVLRRPFHLEGSEVVMSASVGIAVAPTDGDDMETLLRNADAAMRRAKGQGKNSYQFYDRSMKQVSPAVLGLESDLRRALEREELILHYQPKVDCLTGRITSFEALVRWQHPSKGLIPPNDFVPMAEKTGMIMALGDLVLRLACKQAKAWRDADLPVVRMSVNFSATQFRTNRIADTVAQIVHDTPLSPRFLDVEITESTMMQNRAAAVTALAQMKGIGITVAIDDFGTGYSSLSYLKGFPVDSIKIDQSFIRDITRDSDDAAITAAIISMAKTLKLQVVAEGVETEEQLQFLRSRGCDEMQGFLISKAVPAEEATELLRKGTIELPQT